MAARVSPRSLNAREAAVHELLRIEEEGAFIGLSERAEPGDPRDERLATELVAGVTRLRRWLDHRLAPFVRGGLERLDAPLRAVLRVAVYELTETRTPPHAAVSEAVTLARRLVHPGAARLVNGVLRAFLRQPEPPPLPNDPDEALAVRHSHPTWLVRRWRVVFGAEATEALLAYDNTRPVYGLRVNTRRASRETLLHTPEAQAAGAEPSAYLDDLLRVRRLQPVIEAGWLADGRAAVQDEAAALVVHVLAPRSGETVFDVCAAPGGKALYAATLMHDRGRLVASDGHPGRLGLLPPAAIAHGLTIIETVAATVEERAASGAQADAVLLDAPCSGTGVLAKRADLRWGRTPEELRDLVVLQARLLEAAARLVRPGGRLVYSTCSLEPEENTGQVDAFLAAHPAFVRASVAGRVPEPFVTPEGDYAAFPQRHGTDGAYAALLVREATPDRT